MVASKRTSPSAVSVKTPSRTTTWKWKWGLRAGPKRWRKETAPSWASAGAVVAETGADGAEQDPEHGAGEGGIVVEEGADPLREGEHPLADRERG